MSADLDGYGFEQAGGNEPVLSRFEEAVRVVELRSTAQRGVASGATHGKSLG